MVRLPRSSYQYVFRPKDDQLIQDALTDMVSRHPTIGFWQSFGQFREAGRGWNHKRVKRVYREMKFNIRKRAKRRLPELLDAYLFDSLREVRIMCEEWRGYYNTERPHKALKYLTPTKYAEQCYRNPMDEQMLYPQTANGNPFQIEESRLVDKILEKPSPEKSTPVPN